MGRRSGWGRGIALTLVALALSCGGTGGGPSDSGNQFVFESRGSLSLVPVPLVGSASTQVGSSQAAITSDPPFVNPTLRLIATLRDPQFRPMPNQLVTFFAEFSDATFIPEGVPTGTPLACRDPLTGAATDCSNRGAAITDENGQAPILLIAGLTLGRMRVIAEAPPSLNISTGISVDVTSQGFISLGDLSILPATVTFVNPLVQPGGEGPMTIFTAMGGKPPYTWDNTNKSLGRIDQKLPDATPANEKAKYTLIGPIPAAELTDTIILKDAEGTVATATVTVIFAECQLKADGSTITIEGPLVGGETFQIDVGDGVPPFTATDTFPGTLTSTSPQPTCDSNQRNCTLLFTLPTPPVPANPDTILIRDARGCTASIELTVKVELCGNGKLDPGEPCDGLLFDANLDTCEKVKGTGATGALFCTEDCKIDSSSCQLPTPPPG